MAIQINYTDRFGTTHSEAYAKIGNYLVANPALLAVNIYVNAAAREANKDPIERLEYVLRTPSDIAAVFGDSTLKANGKSPLTEMYAWLKTLDDTVQNEHDSVMCYGINWTTGTTDV